MSPGTSWSIGTETARAVASHGCLDRHRPAQRLDRILRPDFLDEIKGNAEHDDGNDDDKACDVAGCRGQRARDKQDDDQRIAEAGEELQPKRRTLDCRSVVGAIGRQPRSHLRGCQSGGRGRELGQEPVHRRLPDILKYWARRSSRAG